MSSIPESDPVVISLRLANLVWLAVNGGAK